MAFRGWPVEAVEFYEGLLADNTKTYWQAHKATFDNDVIGPMKQLVAEVSAEFGEGKIFRPYRDVRFSADKTPYKVQCGATAGGRYLQVSADGLMVAAGYYRMAPAQIARFRAAVDEERTGAELAGITEALLDEGFTLGGDRMKTRPRGVDPEHPRLELLRHRGLFAWRAWPPDDALHTAETRDRVASVWRRLAPLQAWLEDHVGHALDDGRA
jgi:uncharacterized protein (TIGR02453 family)